MKQFNPFPHEAGRYGAPMPRHGDNPAKLIGVERLCARYQGGSEGYDKGGAHWGNPSDVWGVWARIDGQVCCVCVRAPNRDAAINKIRDDE